MPYPPTAAATSAVPLCRGKFRSKPWTAVLEEAKHLVASGVRELNLIAEDTNQCVGGGGPLSPAFDFEHMAQGA